MNDWLHVRPGRAPLIVSVPHAGTLLPGDCADALGNPDAALADTDWHVDRLYGFAAELGATALKTDISRIAIDVNRDPSGASLYPGQATTGLCPTTSFAGEPLYKPGREPDDATVSARRAHYFAPYHMALIGEVARLRTLHPHIVLYDAHSIRSRVPRLFDGDLPHFNIGTAGGVTCDPALEGAVARICRATPHQTVVNGRFRGGWITRHYGRPEAGVHALQMEVAQRLYLDERQNTPSWDPDAAAPLQPILSALLSACMDFAKARS